MTPRHIASCRQRRASRQPLCRAVLSITVTLILIVSSAACLPVLAEPVAFSGRVTDLATDGAVSGARVLAGGVEAVTDAQGHYSLSMPAGTYDLRVEAEGYVGMEQVLQQFDGAAAATVDFALVPRNPSAEQAAILDAKFLPAQDAASAQASIQAEDEPLSILTVTEVPQTIRVLMPDGSVVPMAMDEYLRGVVANEMPPYWPEEALRAQAVASRSYASARRAHADQGADVCTTTHCQVWSTTRYDTTDRAVDDTHDTVIRYDGAIAVAYFHARCDGHTRNVEDVWGGYLPYLRGVSCPLTGVSMYGHGVGMCQHGARTMALAGASFVQILQHYYTGVDVTGPAMMRVEDASLAPTSGDRGTLFTFEATYVGGSSAPPAVANVVIDGHAYALEPIQHEGDGRRYRYQTHLEPGDHTYRFYFDDGRGQVVCVPGSGSLAGPSVSNVGAAPTPASEAGTMAWSATHSTPTDWAAGSLDGVQVDAAGDGALTLAAGRASGVYTSEPIVAPQSFMAVGVTWFGSQPAGASFSLELRISVDGHTWGAWRPVEVDEEMGEGPPLSSELFFGEALAFQYRATLRAGEGGDVPYLENVRVVCIDSSDGPVAAELQPVRALASMPPVISRQAWGANEALMTSTPEYRTVGAMVIHHTATSDGGVDPAAMVRAIYYYHAITREWGDIGYNYLIDVNGNVYEGRAGGAGVVGHHAGWYNYGSVGISLIGNFQESPVPSAMHNSLTSLLAAQCSQHWLDPQGQGFFIDRVLPTIFAHRDVSSTTCPGDYAYALMPTFRAEAKSKMGVMPPQVSIQAPASEALLRGVVDVTAESSGVTSIDFYVDGTRRATVGQAPYTWKWNTTEVGDGAHTLRVVAYNSGGQAEASVGVTVDNTPPSGVAIVPSWLASGLVPITLQSADAVTVQFSNGWVWEGEDLRHQPSSGAEVSDAGALNGFSWLGSATDSAGAWYGPYTLDLTPWADYQVYYRLRTTNRGGSATLARIDVADNQGNRVYAERSITGQDFTGSNVYQWFSLDVAYQKTDATWQGVENGVEFRTWFQAAGDLALDRVAVYSAQVPYSNLKYWQVPAQEGDHVVIVRLVDAAGNVADTAVAVQLDMTPPRVQERTAAYATVYDERSGLDVYSAQYTYSTDQGYSWSHWQSLPLAASAGTLDAVRLEAPAAVGEYVRFRIKDQAGNVLDVPPYAEVPQSRPTLRPGYQFNPTLPLIYRQR